MVYGMYQEILDQPKSIKETFKQESQHMAEISEKIMAMDKIYLIGSGSSISSAYSAKDALEMVTDMNIDVVTGYEFTMAKKIDNPNSAVIATSQSGETADTLAAVKKANDLGLYTVSITNECESSLMKEAKDSVLTRSGHEKAILGTKTYVTQMSCLYNILFDASTYSKSDEILKQLRSIPNLMEKLIKSTEKPNKELAYQFKNEDIFYCMGSGPNYGLSYKLAMTMMMEGALKHACPLYASEFRHGLIERVEKDVPIIILDSGYPIDEVTQKAIDFCDNMGVKTIVYKFNDYLEDMPGLSNLLSPLNLVIPLEWFVYYLAHYNNEDPGSTRHIGKVRYE
ncbi:MAG: SIS domain-containing protein [Methanobacteriaceae archaeon]